MSDDRAVMDASAGERLALILASHQRLTGRTLAKDMTELWSAPRAVVAHATQAEPIFFYGNALALDLFEMPANAFIAMPSRLSAEPMHRDERARLLAEVSAHGFIDDYRGIRISRSGRRFRIEQATVWNLIDSTGAIHGQAATFAHWTPLD